MTDHVWWTWPVPLIGEYTEVRKKIAYREPEWDKKTPQLLWRGVVDMGTVRADLIKATEGKAWSNVRGMAWAGRGGTEGASPESRQDALEISDHCKFQYLIYTEGMSLVTLTSLSHSLKPCRSNVFRPVQIPTQLQ
jgi:hypothetical protein